MNPPSCLRKTDGTALAGGIAGDGVAAHRHETHFPAHNGRRFFADGISRLCRYAHTGIRNSPAAQYKQQKRDQYDGQTLHESKYKKKCGELMSAPARTAEVGGFRFALSPGPPAVLTSIHTAADLRSVWLFPASDPIQASLAASRSQKQPVACDQLYGCLWR